MVTTTYIQKITFLCLDHGSGFPDKKLVERIKQPTFGVINIRCKFLLGFFLPNVQFVLIK